MGVFFCFSNTQLLHAFVGNVFANAIDQFFRRKSTVGWNVSGVLRHHDVVAKSRASLALKAFEFVAFDECTGDFTGAVRAEVEADDGIAVFYFARLVANHSGFNKFVVFVTFVGGLQRINTCWCGKLSLTECHRIVALLDPIPAVIAVHRIETANDRCNRGITK